MECKASTSRELWKSEVGRRRSENCRLSPRRDAGAGITGVAGALRVARALRTSTDVDDKTVKSLEVSSISLVSSRSSPQATEETRAITIKIFMRLLLPRFMEPRISAITRDCSHSEQSSLARA